MSNYKTVWKGDSYQEAIRGQMPSPFYDSEGRHVIKAVWHEERTWRAKCGKCYSLIRFKGITEYQCPKCGAINDVTR